MKTYIKIKRLKQLKAQITVAETKSGKLATKLVKYKHEFGKIVKSLTASEKELYYEQLKRLLQ